MSRDYYFKQWLSALRSLKQIVEIDLFYQTNRTHDKQLCDHVERLAGVLGEYCNVYRLTVTSMKKNMQVQKMEIIREIVQTLVDRIIELKHQLMNLESSENVFLSKGLINHKITPCDVDIEDLPVDDVRPQNVQDLIKEAFEHAEDKRIQIAKQEEEKAKQESNDEEEDKWWENDIADEIKEKSVKGNLCDAIYGLEKKLDAETIRRKELLALILAHEKTRQVTMHRNIAHNKRVLWTKELDGSAKPQPRLEIKNKAAKLIQDIFRSYFKIKRRRIKNCARDELLGFSQCKPVISHTKEIQPYKNQSRAIRKIYETQWKKSYDEMKEKYLKIKRDVIAEDHRDFVREWFLTWFNQLKMFYDIPKVEFGGSIKILREEVPSPDEWVLEYEEKMKQTKANKDKSRQDKKWAKQQAQREAELVKKNQKQQERLEAALKRKYMKNPTMHPGYHYPHSAKIEHIVKSIVKYENTWKELDDAGEDDTKMKFIKEMDFKNICAEVKRDVIVEVDVHMREELKRLKKALKTDYENMEETMPVPFKTKEKKRKIKKGKPELLVEEHLIQKFNDLAFNGILMDYPRTTFQDFSGDPNFAGDEMRCLLKQVTAHFGETRFNCWEKCLHITRSRQFVLLVGPEASGKTRLVYAAATSNDAALYILDADKLSATENNILGDLQLEKTVTSVLTCARASQPSIIFLKNVHKLFYRKVPVKDKNANIASMKKYILKVLCRKIQKNDKITVIGSCVEPWLTKAQPLLKRFPNVLLVPNTNYGSMVQVLNNWILRNHTLPRSLDVHSLAYMLQGYRYGFIQQMLEDFLTADRLVKIAAYGLTCQEIYDYVLNTNEPKVDYDKYLKWYMQKTRWGKKEQHHLNEMMEFKANADRYEQSKKKKKKVQ